QGSQARQPTKHFRPLTASRHGVVADARQQSYNALSASPVFVFLTSSILTNIHIYGFNQIGVSF
ncbi:TPA: hypothetical protein ACWMLL_002710, partial [Enterococcus faecium]